MRGDRRRRLAARRRRIQRPPIASRRSLGKHGSRPQQKVLVAITTGAPPSSERARNLLHEWASKFVEDKSCSTRIRTRKSSPNGKSAVYKPRFTAIRIDAVIDIRHRDRYSEQRGLPWTPSKSPQNTRSLFPRNFVRNYSLNQASSCISMFWTGPYASALPVPSRGCAG